MLIRRALLYCMLTMLRTSRVRLLQAKVAVAGGQIIINILSSHVAIPDFAWFCDELRDIFDEVTHDERGQS